MARRPFKSGSENIWANAIGGALKGYEQRASIEQMAAERSLRQQAAELDRTKLATEIENLAKPTTTYVPDGKGGVVAVTNPTVAPSRIDFLRSKLYGNEAPLTNPEDANAVGKVVAVGGAGGRGGASTLTQSSYVDTDGTPLLFNRATGRYQRSDNGAAPSGTPQPQKGNQEAVAAASRAAEMLPKIDTLFDRLKTKSEAGRRISLLPGIGKVTDPETTQLKSEIKQIGFTFGGKNFTGNEEKIISDALFPDALDNKDSTEAKRNALKGYVSGQIDLSQAANLLGPAGAKMREILNKNAPNQVVSGPVKVTSQKQYDALPPGTQYVDSYGKVTTKK